MSIRLIYGKSGSGKSEFIFNEIKKLINCGKKIYIITPEQFSFTAEKKLLETLDNSAVLNAEVLTFLILFKEDLLWVKRSPSGRLCW